tara:strand:- start:2511 stop:4493 length:1983 start_codon:yes stop_codon:yes gene_type:complete
MKSILRIVLACLFLTLTSCGGIQLLSMKDTSHLYSEQFMAQINKVKTHYRAGRSQEALNELKAMDEQKLAPSERAMRRNLMGVINFSGKSYEQAIFNFDQALTTSGEDEGLTAQIRLNLASSHYKLGFMDRAYAALIVANPKALEAAEARKYYQLRYSLAKDLGKTEDAVDSMLAYLQDKKTLGELRGESVFERLTSLFSELDHRTRLRILEAKSEPASAAPAYLAYLEAEKLYYEGKKDESMSLLNWIDHTFKDQTEILELSKSFIFRIENYAKMDSKSIGVILPLSGDKSEFGKRVLLGLDAALKEANVSTGPEFRPFNLHFRDSEGGGALGAHRVRDLIEKQMVSVVIGGLFSSEATKEYLEARKYGVFFISLSQIFLPKEQKDHLLLEIPGSVESQLAKIFSGEILNGFGKRGAIIYPQGDRGEAYLNEFWRRAKESNVTVTGALSFKEKETDFRVPVEKLLGLHFTRERQEELDLLSEVHALEKKRAVRRIQTLKPQIDFDWVFVPAYPEEALQLVPSFSYFDASNLNIIGTPSWRTQRLLRESSKLGKLYFVGDNVEQASQGFSENFVRRFNKAPRLIEMRSYDALKTALGLLKNKDYKTRDEFNAAIRSNSKLEAMTGIWNLIDGIWIKDMQTLLLHRGRIKEAVITPDQVLE